MTAVMIKAQMRCAVKRFAGSDSGTTAIEYALIAGGIALAIITTVFALGTDNVLPMFQSLTSLF